MMSAPIVFIDCSPIMANLLGEESIPDGMSVNYGDPAPDALEILIAEAAIILNGHTMMDEALLIGAKSLRSIVFLGTGAASYVDLAAAERLGISVRTVRGYGDRTIAEHAFALLLAAARDVARMDRDIRAGRWANSEGVELQGRTLGVVGVGDVGSEMARIGAAFGMRVVAWNRSGVPAGVPAESVDFDTLLAISDAVSLHLALAPETRGLFDAKRLAQLKPGAVLVNTARGALVNEDALVSALELGHIAHAALDVFATEPLPNNHPLTRLANVTLTSHAGWKSRAASRRLLRRALELAAEDARRLAAGHSLET